MLPSQGYGQGGAMASQGYGSFSGIKYPTQTYDVSVVLKKLDIPASYTVTVALSRDGVVLEHLEFEGQLERETIWGSLER